MGGPVNSHIGHLATPALEPAVGFLPRAEAPASQCVALDILYAALDLALGAGTVRLAGVRRKAVIACEVLEQRMPHDPVLTAAEHQRTRVIVKAGEGHASKVAKRTLVAVEQARQLFVAIGVSKQPPRIAEGQDEQMNGLQLLANTNPELSVVDLRLIAWPGLESHRRKLRPFMLGPMGLEIALELLITASEAQAHQLAQQHHPVPSHLRAAPLDALAERIDWPWPGLMPPRLPGAKPEPTLDRLAIYLEFPRNPLDPFATLPPGDDLPHQIPP